MERRTVSILVYSDGIEHAEDKSRLVGRTDNELYERFGIVMAPTTEYSYEAEASQMDANVSFTGYAYDNAYVPDADQTDQLLYPLFISRWTTAPEHYTRRRGWRCYELIYTNSGAGELDVEGQTYRLAPGSICLIDCREPHYYRADSPNGWEYTFIHFDGTTSSYLFSKVHQKGVVFDDVQGTRAGRALEGVIDLARDGSDDFDLLFHGSMTSLLANLTRLDPVDQDAPEWLPEIKAYIGEHCGEDLSLQDLASRAYLSKSRFSHLFKESTGTSPIEYRNGMRIERAKELLTTTSKSVEDVCAMVGFSNLSSFYDRFRRETGMSPGAWRKAQWSGMDVKAAGARIDAGA